MFLADRSKDGLVVEWLVRTEFDIKKLYLLLIIHCLHHNAAA